MLPMVVGMMSASIISGQVISRTGRIRPFPLIGSALICIALFLLSRITADTDLLLVMAVMFGLGYGLGNCMQPLLLILQSAVPPRDIGVATSSATFFRQIGGTLGVAIFLSVLFGSVGGQHQDLDHLGVADPGVPAGRADGVAERDPLDRQVAEAFLHPTPGGGVLAQVQNDSSIIQQMPPVARHPFKVGFAESMDTVFLIAACVGDPGVPGAAADAQGGAPRDLGPGRRSLRGRTDRAAPHPDRPVPDQV